MATAADRPAVPTARLAAAADLPGIGTSLALAFEDDPIWRFLVGPRHGRFVERATAYFRAEAANHMRKAALWTVDGTTAAALWAPPGAWKTDTRSLLHVLLPSTRLFGLRSPVAIAVLNAMEKAHPREPHWYLAVLGTAPAHQGRGLGSAVMAPVLERCDREGIGAYLESSKEQNLAFYARHGFVAGEPLRPHGSPPMWPMWRDPRPDSGV